MLFFNKNNNIYMFSHYSFFLKLFLFKKINSSSFYFSKSIKSLKDILSNILTLSISD